MKKTRRRAYLAILLESHLAFAVDDLTHVEQLLLALACKLHVILLESGFAALKLGQQGLELDVLANQIERQAVGSLGEDRICI